MSFSKTMWRLGLAPAAIALLATAGAFAQSGQVVVSSYGGTFQDAQEKAFFKPFAEASGLEVVGATGSSFAKVKSMIEAGAVTWDVVSSDSSAFANEVAEGLLAPIDYTVVDATGIPEDMRHEFGVGYIKFGINIAWNKDKFPDGVTAADFFNPEVEARRGMIVDPSFNMELALLADGVAAADLYPLDVDRAFTVLDRVKDQVVAFKGSADIQALMQQGEVDLVFAPSGRISDVISSGGNWDFTWDGSVADTEWWVVVKDAPNAANAMKFIDFAVKAEPQAALAIEMPYGPTNEQAFALLDEELSRTLPTFSENAKLGATLDSLWWQANLAEVQPRWSAWLLQ